MPDHRIHTVSTRMTLAEKNWLLARCGNVQPSEYVRAILLREKDEPDALKMLAAEGRRLESIVCGMLALFLSGRRPTEREMREIMRLADATKYDRGAEAIRDLEAAKERGAA